MFSLSILCCGSELQVAGGI